MLVNFHKQPHFWNLKAADTVCLQLQVPGCPHLWGPVLWCQIILQFWLEKCNSSFTFLKTLKKVHLSPQIFTCFYNYTPENILINFVTVCHDSSKVSKKALHGSWRPPNTPLEPNSQPLNIFTRVDVYMEHTSSGTPSIPETNCPISFLLGGDTGIFIPEIAGSGSAYSPLPSQVWTLHSTARPVMFYCL